MCSCSYEGQGQPLVEVFGVRFLPGGEAPAGTISVFDGKRGQILYSGGPVDKPSTHQTQRSGGELPLTGPYRAVSADGCVAILLDLHQRGGDDSASSSPLSSSYVAEILLDVYDEATKYDEAITSAVSSTRGDSHVEVTYALISDAAVEVRLLGQRAGRTVSGTVVARTDLGAVVLFDDRTEEALAGTIPLARSVVAVPLASLLTVEVDLVVGEETVKESVVCMSKLGCEEVCPAAGASPVEVKIKWMD